MRVYVANNGLRYIEHEGVRFAVLIPSRMRAEIMARHPLREVANLFVHRSELAAYERQGLKPFPHEEHGFVRITNYMLDRAWSAPCDFVLRTDDDGLGLRELFSRLSLPLLKDADSWLGVVFQDGLMALESGAPLFGYAMSARPVARSAFRPFSLRTWLKGGCLGFTDASLRADTRLLHTDDVDLSLQALAKAGLVLGDNRFYFVTRGRSHGRDKGGAEGVRTPETQLQDYLYLREKYGPDVVQIDMRQRMGEYVRLRIRL